MSTAGKHKQNILAIEKTETYDEFYLPKIIEGYVAYEIIRTRTHIYAYDKSNSTIELLC